MSFVVRLILRTGARWLLARAVGRFLVRRFARSTVEAAGRELEVRAAERLPAPLARAVTALPPEVMNAGGGAVVASRAARNAVTTTRQVGRVAGSTTRLAGRTGRRATSVVGAARSVVGQARVEADEVERQLRSRYLDATVGPEAGVDALLDVRTVAELPLATDAAVDPVEEVDALHDAVPDPVARGRRRFRRRRPAPVNRVRRSYRPPSKPWD